MVDFHSDLRHRLDRHPVPRSGMWPALGALGGQEKAWSVAVPPADVAPGNTRQCRAGPLPGESEGSQRRDGEHPGCEDGRHQTHCCLFLLYVEDARKAHDFDSELVEEAYAELPHDIPRPLLRFPNPVRADNRDQLLGKG